MAGRSISPSYGRKTFTCTRCGEDAVHTWAKEGEEDLPRGGWLELSTCTRCHFQMVWRVTQSSAGRKRGTLVHPKPPSE